LGQKFGPSAEGLKVAPIISPKHEILHQTSKRSTVAPFSAIFWVWIKGCCSTKCRLGLSLSKKPKSTKRLPKRKRFETNFSVVHEIELFRKNYFATQI